VTLEGMYMKLETKLVTELKGSSLRSSAVEVANRGYRVFTVCGIKGEYCACGNPACRSPGKHPSIKDWQQKASSDPIVVDRFWTQLPDANIGVATGQESGVVVLDIDGQEGEATLKRLIETHGELPGTLTATTGRGRHLYFQAPDIPIRNGVGKLGPGLDIRGEGGYVVAPPSQHHSGATYEWVDSTAEVAEMPEWIIQLLSETKQKDKKVNVEDRFSEGSRNDTLFKIGASMRGIGHSEAEIATALSLVNEDQCDPPLSADEVRDIAKSVAAYPVGNVTPATDGKNSFWWFPIDVNEWCRDRRILFLKDYQVGWLMWLKVEAWNTKGFLPSDPKTLAVLARAASEKKFLKELPAVMAFFEQTTDAATICDRELAAYWEDKATLVEKNRKAGKVSGKRRREQEGQIQKREGTE
jgi:uncharacterized protein YdaU (DUF1376 family)